MLQLIRIVLGAPFAAIWSLLMRIRRSIYNRNGGKHRCQYPFPVINVGNLSMGGTGKTPNVEYLVRLLQNRYSLAVLSRGYGRKTKGFRFADHTSNSHEIGDEPLQYHKKYPHLPVAVDENRRDGIEKIKQVLPDTQVMLLDDAFQHLRIKAGLNILLTDYNNLYTDDHVMPYGDLRESPSAAKDAEIIIVTKCPSVLSQLHEKTIKEKLNPLPHQKVFFSYTTFLPIVPFNKKAKEQTNEIKSVVLLTAIANPQPLISYLKTQYKEFQSILFRDHKQFSTTDLEKVKQYVQRSLSPYRAVIVTEKDAMRLFKKNLHPLLNELPIYTLPIQVEFHQKYKQDFDQYILDYVEKNL